MDPNELMLTAARAGAVYVLMLLVFRALGKRTVGNFSAFDLLVALMLGELVDEIIYGDVGFMQGTVAIVAIVAIVGLAFADSWLALSAWCSCTSCCWSRSVWRGRRLFLAHTAVDFARFRAGLSR